ncbi:MAG: TrkA C-terminal domain-containing protein [Chloroflexi bacterium]|nr:TrkA C-terminal domain-containing protein [Chloroflexota bacterium]
MGFLLPTLLVISVCVLVVRGAAIALMMTGVDQETARFQALSAFTGTGFTTRESEMILNHPQRRRIISWLMVLGYAGIVTVIVTGTSSVVTSHGYEMLITLAVLFVGIYVVVKVARNQGLIRRWERFVENRFIKSRIFEGRPTEDLVQINPQYGLLRVTITASSPFIGSALSGVKLPEQGGFFVGIERDLDWISLPKAEEKLKEGDRLVVYGQFEELRSIFEPGYRRRDTIL